MYIKSKYSDYIGEIKLSHPETRNAICKNMAEEFLSVMKDMKEKNARVLILSADTKNNVWSAGHNIHELPEGKDPLNYADALEKMLRSIKSFPAPIIAMIHGSVWGGATDLVVSCDMAIGDETSSFAITPVNLGVPYNITGLLQFMRRLPFNFLKEMFFTAQPVKAEDALQWGLLNHLVTSEELVDFTFNIAKIIATKAPLAVQSIKEQLQTLADADPITPAYAERIQDLRQRVFESEDYAEGIKAFKEKRKPVFKGK